MKQTLEEFSERMSTVIDGIDAYSRNGCKKAIIIGAKWQQEQAKEKEINSKLRNQLFIGKVSEIIGENKTIELLIECRNVIPQ